MANPAAFGIFGFSFLEQNSDAVQGSKINGVDPEFEAIATGDYPVSRSLYFYVKNAHVGVIPGISEFLAEFTSEDTWGPDGYLEERGMIPMPENEREFFKKNAEEIIDILKDYSFLIRKILSQKVEMKFLPKLLFRKDESFEYAEKIENLIKQTNK